MPSSDSETQNGTASDERSPLLNSNHQPADNGTLENANGTGNAGQNENPNGVPLAEEPSTKKLITTMGSIWVGSFLAALGRQSVHL